ncbi:acyltransferase family protein [Niabella sp. 22666]|uniref:acyltransferase family protein n=1 Tax=Niabella sp. 22666 TaxID=3453954 RepID=UPI003F8730B8
MKNIDNDQSIIPGKRLLSLDALRGFDMFWIVSGEGIFHGIAKAIQQKYGLIQDQHTWQIEITNELTWMEKIGVGISNQLHHTVWNGFTFYDLIFPLFIFIAGISMPFSYGKQLSAGPGAKKKIYRALLKRTVLLLLLGMVVNGLLQWKPFEETRFASVLGRIALSCFFAAIIYLNASFRWRITWFVLILTGYWMAMELIPVPGFGPGILAPEGNLSAYIDRLWLPGKLHRGVYDPEGWLSTIPAVATALLGIFTGEILRNARYTAIKKVLGLSVAGVFFLLAGLAWDTVFPINKNIWSSSFVLYAGGWSLLLFAFFYFIIDVRGIIKWSLPFVWMGCNSILIYLAAHGLVNFLSTSEFILNGITQRVDARWHDAILWTGVALIQFAALYGLYKKKIFLKL